VAASGGAEAVVAVALAGALAGAAVAAAVFRGVPAAWYAKPDCLPIKLTNEIVTAGFDWVDPAVPCLHGRATGVEPWAGQHVAAAPRSSIVEKSPRMRCSRKLFARGEPFVLAIRSSKQDACY
jgi:hypothetical protein